MLKSDIDQLRVMIHEICKVLGEEFCLVDQSSYLLDMDSITPQGPSNKEPGPRSRLKSTLLSAMSFSC